VQEHTEVNIIKINTMNIIYYIKKFLGYHYLLNTHTNEVHDLHSKKDNCGTRWMSNKNRKLVSKERYMKLLKLGEVNSCRWCLNDATYTS